MGGGLGVTFAGSEQLLHAVVWTGKEADAAFIEDRHEAEPDRGEGVLHLDRRPVAKNGAADDAVTHQLPPALVHYLRGQAGAGAQRRAGPDSARGDELQQHDVVRDQIEAILDVWYGFVGSNPHLLASFTDPAGGQPIGDYLGAVRARFGEWILNTASANYDQAWLDYQHEIGLRHHRAKKNRTDGVASTEIVPFRYLTPLIFPVTATLKPFLAKGGHSSEEVDRMHAAWVKSCLLQVTLWSPAYVNQGDF